MGMLSPKLKTKSFWKRDPEVSPEGKVIWVVYR
jgi:hypothetical protein